MSQTNDKSSANYVSCRCRHCDRGIEFDANQIDWVKNIQCPHCQMETTLFIPAKSVPPVIPATKRKRNLFVWLLIVCGLMFLVVFAVILMMPVHWIKSGTAQDRNVTVTVARMYLSPDFTPNWPGGGVTPTTENLHVLICVSNTSSDLKINFESWGNDGTAYLTDNAGNNYQWINFGEARPEYLKRNFVIFPHETIMDNVVFEKPILSSKWFHLELMGHNYGGYGALRFELPVKVYGSAF